MTRMLAGFGTGVALAICAAGCAEGDATHVNPSARGGTSGSPSASAGSGGAGASAGSGGSGGTMEPDPLDAGDAGSARFRAVLEGDTMTFTSSSPVWLVACEDNPRLVQRSDDTWALLRDDRPEAFGLQLAAHYLDGAYHSDCNLSLGCDVGFCQPFPESPQTLEGYRDRLLAREYVQVGQREARSCDGADAGSGLDAGSDAGARAVPDIESRAPSGPLGVRVRYYLDSQCQTGALTEDIAVE